MVHTCRAIFDLTTLTYIEFEEAGITVVGKCDQTVEIAEKLSSFCFLTLDTRHEIMLAIACVDSVAQMWRFFFADDKLIALLLANAHGEREPKDYCDEEGSYPTVF